jgi:glutamate dehydrogenase
MFEIYVYAPDMEGIHLRGGRIARGGIRWSDRMDYRTEVFGLMRAQMTKNAIIVPTGAKGGFFLKDRPSDPDRLKREVERQYVRYIEALLDVTDNLVDGEVVHPEDVIVHDEDDTYMVVAADKGTATFSDTANEMRGAAEVLARRRVRVGRLGRIRPQGAGDHRQGRVGVREAPLPRTGDRPRGRRHHGGGDRRHVRRRVRQRHAAEPDAQAHRRLRPPARLHRSRPRPARSFEERKRLFELPGSSWDDYDKERCPRAAASSRATPSGSSCPSRRGRCSGIEHDEVLSPPR